MIYLYLAHWAKYSTENYTPLSLLGQSYPIREEDIGETRGRCQRTT